MLVSVTGLLLILIGVLVLIIAATTSSEGSVSAGVVIFIGPIPIVFGAGPDAGILVLTGVILAVASLILFVALRRKM